MLNLPNPKRLTTVFSAFLVILLVLLKAVVPASALEIDNRRLLISTSIGGVTAQHVLSFSLESSTTLGSIVLEYCTSPVEAVTCLAPNGLDISGMVLSSQTGETGFSIISRTANTFMLGRAPAASGLQPNSYTFDNIVNPADKGAFFLRISTYASNNGTGPKLDYGATAGSITQTISISAEVPPILQFCVGITIQGFCTVIDGSFLDLGILNSSRAAVGTSRFQVYTNAEFGYVVTVNGATMISGNHVIPALAAPTTSSPGVQQFGINLRANTAPAVGADPIVGSGVVSANYNIPNKYSYNDGDVLVTNHGIGDFETYTVTYLVNVLDNQTPGIYNTILDYVCTATF
jgi:hypothetical protein